MLPLQLNGINLGERQKQLNDAVNNTKTWDPRYDADPKEEEADVDVLFKIDLASKLRNINYLISILKGGDSLHISRVLKHVWIYDAEYSELFNPVYLHGEIFPYMSEKMKKKFLTALSMHVKDEARLYDFSKYCFANKRDLLGYKFLTHMSLSHKLDFVSNKKFPYDYLPSKEFIDSSFELAQACLDKMGWLCSVKLTFLYSVSNVEYLDMFEKHEGSKTYFANMKFGIRISEDIIKKHKNRVLSKPTLYVHFLNTNVLLKNISVDDAKVIVKSFFPEKDFWNSRFLEESKIFVDKLPQEERFKFIKEVFEKKYPGEEFEMRQRFFFDRYYNLMTVEEQEAWAMKHIQMRNGFFGDVNDYTWYKFVNFTESFKIMKGIINKTMDQERRYKMINILIQSTRDQNDLVILLKHLYERHVNERRLDKFVAPIFVKYNVYEFDINCWTEFNKLLHAMQVYNLDVHTKTEYALVIKCRITGLVYHILHDIPLPEYFIKFIKSEISNHFLTKNLTPLKKMEAKNKICDALIEILIRELSKYDDKLYTEEIKNSVEPIISNAINILKIFEREIFPEIIIKYAKLDSKFSNLFTDSNTDIFTENDLLRLLKKDVFMANKKIPSVPKFLEGNLRQFLKKLKIYFPNDATKEWLNFYINELTIDKGYLHKRFSAVHSIFIIGDSACKIELLKKYAPESPKIDHADIYNPITYIQQGMCRFMGYSRPPVPLSIAMLYIKGDYLRYCLPLFSMFAANLPTPLSRSFVQLLLEQPVSIQKHGIRLAFESFSSQDLGKIVTTSWMQTKNTSLRKILFVSLFNHVREVKDENAQGELVNILKTLMSSLKEDDDDAIFQCLGIHNLPEKFKADSVEYTWNIVEKFIDHKVNWRRKKDILYRIVFDIHLFKEEFIHGIVEKTVDKISEETIPVNDTDNGRYETVKWDLLGKYLINSKNIDSLERKINILKLVTIKIFDLWDMNSDGVYHARKIFDRFVTNIAHDSIRNFLDEDGMVNSSRIFEFLLQEVTSFPHLFEMYPILWNIKLTITLQNIIHKYKLSYDEEKRKETAIVRDTAKQMGKAIGVLLKEFVDNKLYYSSVKDVIEQTINDFVSIISGEFSSTTEVGNADMLIYHGIIEVDVTEAYFLVISMLSSSFYRDYDEDERMIINKLKSIDIEEVKCAMYLKYCNNHKRAKYY